MSKVRSRNIKQPKLILTIKQKCGECNGSKNTDNCSPNAYFCEKTKKKINLSYHCHNCKSCKGKGTQTAENYDLRDFEKCDCGGRFPNCGCVNPQRYIPFKDYKIKKVSEILTDINKNDSYKADILYIKFKKHNLKEDDKLMVRRR